MWASAGESSARASCCCARRHGGADGGQEQRWGNGERGVEHEGHMHACAKCTAAIHEQLTHSSRRNRVAKSSRGSRGMQLTRSRTSGSSSSSSTSNKNARTHAHVQAHTLVRTCSRSDDGSSSSSGGHDNIKTTCMCTKGHSHAMRMRVLCASGPSCWGSKA